MTTTLHLLIPHASRPAILLLPDESGWSLPTLLWPERLWPPEAAARINREVAQQWGCQTTVLRTLHFHRTRGEAGQMRAVIALENHGDSDATPAGGQWLALDDLKGAMLGQPEHRPYIEEFVAELNGAAVPEIRPPWQRPGWYDEAAAWFARQLALTGPIEQEKTWGISCILRAPSAGGTVYFKVATDRALFAHEPLLTAALAQRFPGHVPEPLALDVDRRWMVIADFGPQRAEDLGPAVWDEMLRLYARMQRETAGRPDDLFAIGCLDRRPATLPAEFDALLADESVMVELEAAEQEKLRDLAPRIEAICQELAGFSVPPALAHGDLHPGNVAWHNGRFVFFDWTDACVAHPFIDLVTMFDRVEGEDSEAVRGRLLDAYLAEWVAFEPLERLRAAWRLAEPLALLHQAISYRHIVNGLESALEFSGATAYFLRKAMEKIRALESDEISDVS